MMVGHGWLLAAGFTWALPILHARRHAWRRSPLDVLPWQMSVATALLWILALVAEPAGHLAFDLSELRLKRPRIDFDQHIALTHQLAFAKQHPHDLAIDTTAHGDGAHRCNGAEAGEVNLDVNLLRRLGNHRRDASAAVALLAKPAASALCRPRDIACRGCVVVVKVIDGTAADQTGQNRQHPDQAALHAFCRR